MSLYNDVEDVLAKDLGLSAPNFLKRQVERHLNRNNREIAQDDLEELSKWCYTGVKLTLGEDTAIRVKRNVLSLKS